MLNATAAQHASSADGDAGSVKDVATKAKAPAMAAGATVVGLLALKSRRRRKKVLGLSLPRSSELEMKSLAKTLGKASKEFAKTSKRVSKDIERVGDQAERIAKILS